MYTYVVNGLNILAILDVWEVLNAGLISVSVFALISSALSQLNTALLQTQVKINLVLL